MSAPPRLIALTDREVDGLFGIGPLGVLLYLSLRRVMDFREGTAGRSTPISLNGLAMACETHTTRGRGVQITRPSEKETRGALAKLERNGLLRRLPGDALAFRLPLALTASARPNQTGHDAGTDSSTQPGTVQPASTLVMQVTPGTDAAPQQRPNRAHIEVKENQNLAARPAAPVDNRGSRTTADRSARGADVTHGAPPPGSAEESRLLAIGRQRGIAARPGESWSEFAARIFRRSPAPAQQAARY